MIAQPHFSVAPWSVTEEELDLGMLAQAESVLALSNGHIGLRANLDEGEPYGMPGTYLNAFYEVRPLPYAEAGYGYPEEGQTIVNVTNGKLIRLLVDDEPFDVRYGTLVSHRRTLDLRAGVLRREVHWRSPAGREIEVRSVRLVSFVHRSVAAVRYEVKPLDGETRIVLQSEIVANEDVPARSEDPRAAAILASPLVSESHGTHELRAVLVHRTRESALRMAAGMDHEVEGPEGTVTENESFDDLARVTVSAEVGHGETLDADQVHGLRVVQPALDGLDPRPGRRRARVRAAHGVRRPARGPARVPRRLSGSARTSRSTATTSSSRPCASLSSTPCSPPLARRSARSRPRA